MKEARVVLENGQVFKGTSFGAEGEKTATLVFHTNMMGYQEILTNPVYFNSIVVMTYPLIGNYGVNKNDMNSDKAHSTGLIVQEYSKIVSNWQADDNLSNFLKEYQVIAIEGIDTRSLVRLVRNKGTMKAVITTKNTKKSSLLEKLKNSNSDKLIDKVSCSKSYIWPESKKNKKLAVVVDLGVDFTLLNWLSDKGYKAKVVPFDYDYKKMLDSKPDVIVFSNGPQGPANYIEIINKSRKLTGHVPLVGYGLGNIILGMSLGLKSYKMKSGHHGSNYPIKDITSNKTYMTAQDHLYCLRDDSIKDKNEITAVNLNDGSVEGFQNKKQKISGFNYLPEVLNI